MLQLNTIKQAVGIALLAVILGFSFNYIRQDGLPVIESQEDLFLQCLEEKELESITIKDAQEILNTGKAVFVDLRPEDDFNRSHIPESHNFPSENIYDLLTFLDQKISKQTEIIFLGADREDDAPAETALFLQMMEYENVKIMAEGWNGWKKKKKYKKIVMKRLIRLITSPILAAVFRWILGLIFIYASIHKIADPFSFSEAIYNYKILPDVLINPLAIWLPWLELIAGLSLIIGIYINGGALIISFLSLLFAIALGSAFFRDLDISCGCFYSSGTNRNADWVTIAQDLGLLIMGLQVLIFDNGKYALTTGYNFTAKKR